MDIYYEQIGKIKMSLIISQSKEILQKMDINHESDSVDALILIRSIFNNIENTSYPMVYILPYLTYSFPDLRDRLHNLAHTLDKWKGNPYHSSAHHAKVTLASVLLGQYHKLSESDLELLVTTASVHDYDYHKGPKAGDMEKLSIKEAFRDGFVPENMVSSVMELNKATIFPDFRRDAYKELPSNDIRVILSDADLIGSCGISFEAYERETALIEKEFGFTLDPAMRLGWLEQVGSLNSAKNTIFEAANYDIISKQKYKVTHS